MFNFVATFRRKDVLMQGDAHIIITYIWWMGALFSSVCLG